MRLNVYSVRTELKEDMAQQRPSVLIHHEHPKAAILDEGNIFWTMAGAVDGFIYLVNMTRVTNFT